MLRVCGNCCEIRTFNVLQTPAPLVMGSLSSGLCEAEMCRRFSKSRARSNPKGYNVNYAGYLQNIL